MLALLKALATKEAFTPHPLDWRVPISQRYGRRVLAGIDLHADSLEVCLVTFENGMPVFSHEEHFNFGLQGSEIEFLRKFREKHAVDEAVVNLTHGYTADRITHGRNPGSEDELRRLLHDDPKAVLGESVAQDTKYAVVFHPTHNFAVTFKWPRKVIMEAKKSVQDSGLRIARLGCGVASLFALLVRDHWNALLPECEVYILDTTSLVSVAVAERQFQTVGFDANLATAELGMEVEKRLSRATYKPGQKIASVNGTSTNLAVMVTEKNLGVQVVEPLREWRKPGLTAVCLENSYDLLDEHDQVRPFAPQSLRAVPVAFWSIIALSVLVIAFNVFREHRSSARHDQLQEQSNQLEQTAGSFNGTLRSVRDRVKLADTLRDWLAISPPLQKLLMELTQSVEPPPGAPAKSSAVVDSMAVDFKDGLPQLEITIVVLTDDAQSANIVFRRVSAMLGREGYSTIDYKESIVPNGFRYDHIVNLPASPR